METRDATSDRSTRRGAVKLTETLIKASIPDQGRVLLWDSKITNLVLRLTSRGQGSWAVDYRVGRRRRITIGRWPAIQVEDSQDAEGRRIAGARALARGKLAEIAAGRDPLAERQRKTELVTVGQALDIWLAEHADRKRPSTRASYRRAADLVRERWGARPVAELRREDLARLRNELATEPYRANRTLAAVSVWLSWCVEAGHRIDNPARGLKRFAEEARQVYLSAEQLAAIEKAIADTVADAVTRDALLLIARTGWRRNEVLRLRWEQLDLEKALAHFDSKSGPTSRPLTRQAVELLRQRRVEIAKPIETRDGATGRAVVLEHPAARSPWCFPSPRDQRKPLATVHKSWERARAAAGFPSLRLHDLRHSIGTALVTIGTPLPLVAKMLGHRSLAATARYAHASDPAAQATAAALSDHFEAARQLRQAGAAGRDRG